MMQDKGSDAEAIDKLVDVSYQGQDFGDPDDPCNSYEWSVVYLLLLTSAVAFIGIAAISMYKRRDVRMSGFDIGVLFLFVCTFIQFGPRLSTVLHLGHGISHYSQSGCKLLHYTDYGIRHVIMCLVFSLALYAWLITKHNFNQEQVDKRIRDNVPWLIMLAFAIEAVFGMPVAIYVDILPKYSEHCVWTPTMQFTKAELVAMEILMIPMIPYIMPLIVLPLPLFILGRTLPQIDGHKLKSQIRAITVIGWAYIGLNFPYSLTYIAHYIIMMEEDLNQMLLVCHFMWLFFLLHQSFFVLVPWVMLWFEVQIGNPPPGSRIFFRVWDKLFSAWRSIREERSELA